MTVRSRMRRFILLAGNLRGLVRFAGGVPRFVAYTVRKLLAGEWRHLVPWMTAAAYYAQRHARRRNANRYRRWLAGRRRPTVPDGVVLALVSTVGVDSDRLSIFIRLVVATQRPRLHVVVLVEARQLAAIQPMLARVGSPVPQVVAVPDASPDTMVAVVREHVGEDDVGADAQEVAYEYVSFFAPGCLPGEMPLPARSKGKMVIYGDEDVIDDDGYCSQPLFKPGFSPDLLMHANYLSPCVTVTVELAQELLSYGVGIGDFHSLCLILVERADSVQHIDAFSGHRFVADTVNPLPGYLPHYLRHRYGAGTSISSRGDAWLCHFGNRADRVSVVIPTRDRIDLLAPCVESIYRTNMVGSFEVLVVDNGSTRADTRRWLAAAASRYAGLRVLDAPGTFNWSRLNNLGVHEVSGDVLIFLNNDTESLCQNWLARLADVAARPDVGVVGALLLYPNGRIQHAGIVTGVGGCLDHIYSGVDPDTDGYLFVPPTVPRNVAAVTGACFSISRATIEKIGLFDEEYQVVGSDVEMCIRALDAGLLNVYLPDVQLIHHESQSRRRKDPPGDVNRLRALLTERCPHDPYYHVDLSVPSFYPSYDA